MTQNASVAEEVAPSAKAQVFLASLLKRFPARSQAIFGLRFGLDDGEEKTLEAIGEQYGITRERVRQVVDVQLKKMRGELAQHTAHPAVLRIQAVLAEQHGIMTVAALKEKIAAKDLREGQALLALLSILPGCELRKETADEYPLVVMKNFDTKRRQQVVETALKVLKQENDVLEFSRLYALVQEALGSELSIDATELEAYLAPSKQIEANAFGRYGLSEWESVRPRGTRERAHLILKVFKKPLHFREIARLIDEHGLYKPGKKTHPQTVHNELIKDKRFVLVGRGTYALSDWGYTKGTVRQVLTNIMKEHAEPMTREELLKAVLKVRQVKKSTVIINLNTFFTKVGKNIYSLGDKA